MNKEYIEREAVINILFRHSQIASEPPMDVEDVAILKELHQISNEIKNTPAENVKLIETAYWDWKVDGTHFCSECGNDVPLRHTDEYCSFYCPYCGRRMTHVENPISTNDEEIVKIRTIVMEGPGELKTAYYTPTCKFGYHDCIYDDAYIKTTYPKWYKTLQQREGVRTCDCCIQGDKYDDEDK